MNDNPLTSWFLWYVIPGAICIWGSFANAKRNRETPDDHFKNSPEELAVLGFIPGINILMAAITVLSEGHESKYYHRLFMKHRNDLVELLYFTPVALLLLVFLL